MVVVDEWDAHAAGEQIQEDDDEDDEDEEDEEAGGSGPASKKLKLDEGGPSSSKPKKHSAADDEDVRAAATPLHQPHTNHNRRRRRMQCQRLWKTIQGTSWTQVPSSPEGVVPAVDVRSLRQTRAPETTVHRLNATVTRIAGDAKNDKDRW